MATLAERLAQPDMTALSDAEAAAALNAPGGGVGTTRQDINSEDLFDGLSDTGAWGRVEQWSRPLPTGTLAAPSPQDLQVARCISVVRVVDRGATIRTSRDAILTEWTAIFGGLRTDGLITAAARTRLIALLTRPATWAEQNGFPGGVTSRDVGLARGSVA